MFRDQFGWQVIAEDNGPVRDCCANPVPATSLVGWRAVRAGRSTSTVRAAVPRAREPRSRRCTYDADRSVRGSTDRAGDIDGLEFDQEPAAHRRAFVHAVQASVDLGVLELADGNEESFATSGTGDALYRVNEATSPDCWRHRNRLRWPPTLSGSLGEPVHQTEDGLIRQRGTGSPRRCGSEPVCTARTSMRRSGLPDGPGERVSASFSTTVRAHPRNPS